jgi:hypothetical protein
MRLASLIARSQVLSDENTPSALAWARTLAGGRPVRTERQGNTWRWFLAELDVPEE